MLSHLAGNFALKVFFFVTFNIVTTFWISLVDARGRLMSVISAFVGGSENVIATPHELTLEILACME